MLEERLGRFVDACCVAAGSWITFRSILELELDVARARRIYILRRHKNSVRDLLDRTETIIIV